MELLWSHGAVDLAGRDIVEDRDEPGGLDGVPVEVDALERADRVARALGGESARHVARRRRALGAAAERGDGVVEERLEQAAQQRRVHEVGQRRVGRNEVPERRGGLSVIPDARRSQ